MINNKKTIMKYIKHRDNFLFEQDFGMDQQEQAQLKQKEFFFLFLDDNLEQNKKNYPDGSSEVEYPTYSIGEFELNDWIKKNIIKTDKNKLTDTTEKLRQENLKDIVSGKKVNISSDDLPFIEKLKNAALIDTVGRREPETKIIFTSDGIPTTNNILVTFIPLELKKD